LSGETTSVSATEGDASIQGYDVMSIIVPNVSTELSASIFSVAAREMNWRPLRQDLKLHQYRCDGFISRHLLAKPRLIIECRVYVTKYLPTYINMCITYIYIYMLKTYILHIYIYAHTTDICTHIYLYIHIYT